MWHAAVSHIAVTFRGRSLNAVLYLSAVLMGLAAAAMLLLRIETRGRNLT